MKKNILLMSLAILLTSCSGKKGGGSANSLSPNYQSIASFSVNEIKINNEKMDISGVNLDMTSYLKLKIGSNVYPLNILSKSKESLSANLQKGLAIASGELITLLVGNAYGESAYPAIFTISNNSITTEMIKDGAISQKKLSGVLSGEGVQSGQSLVWNGSNWVAQTPTTTQVYMGGYDASTGEPSILHPHNPGEYYIVQKNGTQDLGLGPIDLKIGDTLMSDGVKLDVIPNATPLVSVHGRIGAVIAQQDDYTWAQIKKTVSSIGDITDIDYTNLPIENDFLKFNGTKWVPTQVQTTQEALSGKNINGITFPTDSSGTLGVTAVPFNLTDVTNKSYVDSAISALNTSLTNNNAKIEYSPIELATETEKGTSLSLYITKATTTVISKAMEIVGLSTNSNTATVRIAGMSSGAGTQDTYSPSSNEMKASLDINGSAITRTYSYGATSSIDVSKSNSIVVTAPSSETLALTNVQEGGNYDIILQDSSAANIDFTVTKAEDGAAISGANIKWLPARAPRATGKHAIYTVTRKMGFVYIFWSEL